MSPLRAPRRDALPALALLALLGATCALLWRARLAEPPPLPPSTSIPGEELVVVFLGSSTCGASRVPELPARMRSLRDTLERHARERGRRAVLVGVASDAVVEDGLAFLEPFGRFDEVIVGRGWLNHGLIRYVWRDHPGAATIPQLVVLTRSVSTPDETTLEVGPETILLRKVGLVEIRRWAEAGFPLPAD